MRIVRAARSAVLAGLIAWVGLVASGSATAAILVSPVSSAPEVRLIADDAPSDRAEYLRKAQADMAQWREKMRDTAKAAKQEGREAGGAAKSDLD